MAEAPEIAEWMMEELRQRKSLYQEDALAGLIRKFGREFCATNEAGNEVIGKAVLKHFKELSKDSVVWERGERMWRLRKLYDSRGRQQE